MPFITYLLTSLFPVLAAWAIQFLTRKIVVVGITIAAFLLLTSVFLAVIKAIVLSVLALAILPSWVVSSVGLFLPFNFAFVLSMIISAQSVRWAYDKAMDKIQMINTAT